MLYFKWLQKDNPTGTPDRFPELRDTFETSVPGLYCIGDLTGVPLIKLAAESGYELIERLAKDDSFTKERKHKPSDMYDLIIVGAGPAGVAASIRATELGLKHVVLESSKIFNTIANFPAGKPVYVTPAEPPMKSAVVFSDGTKESLLEELSKIVATRPLPLHEGEMVKRIVETNGSFSVQTSRGKYNSRRVVVAIGKTGNARTLGVPGETLPKVFTRLIDAAEFNGQDILVVGGGDSAVEAAVALANAGNRVAHSYRKATLSRPKEQNLRVYNTLVSKGAIVQYFDSAVTKIEPDKVVLLQKKQEKVVANNVVFALIGSEIPIEFFRRSNIRMEGERRFVDWMKMAGMILFAAVLYFGKKAPGTTVSGWGAFWSIPTALLGKAWPHMVNGLFAWVSLIGFVAVMLYLIAHFVKHAARYFNSSWSIFKYTYFLANGVLFAWLFVAYKYLSQRPLFSDMGSWYTVLYSVTIVIFGLRRIVVTPTGYIKRQTLTLMVIQVLPLFVIPMFLLPFMGKSGMLSGWIMTNVFPGGSYWRGFGFILAWPLFIHNLATNQPTIFWLVMGTLQTFVIIPYIVYRFGKGAYCGWICSCGALAETLGDEYRTQAPHGETAKKWENAGQFILWFAFAVTLLALFAGQSWGAFSRFASHIYAIIVDIVFAGVLGVGVYFAMSGRVWCRFFCPLASLMHIYARFSVYRIFSNKKRCISCNICTRVCHMGIDVMSYANKGIPMNDVECVRCSACIVSCPMQVLTFGSVDTVDLHNVAYKTRQPPVVTGWKSGLE